MNAALGCFFWGLFPAHVPILRRVEENSSGFLRKRVELSAEMCYDIVVSVWGDCAHFQIPDFAQRSVFYGDTSYHCSGR